MKSYLSNIILCSVVLLLITMTISCGEKKNKLSYNSAHEASIKYQELLEELRKKDFLSTPELCADINSWLLCDQAVGNAVEIDVQNDEKFVHYIYKFLHTRDSIKQEFYRLILTEKRTYKDVLLLQQATLPIIKDSLLTSGTKKAETFFHSLQMNDTYKGTIEQLLKEYRSFLDEQLSTGIHSKAEMLTFIKKEDTLFRALLEHLPEAEKHNISDIIINSEKCCKLIYQAQTRGEISYDDAVIYLTIRTNNRLILNMKACVDDTRKGKVKTPDQARAYMYMLLQPYSTIDGMGMAMLSEEQRKMLFKVADDTEGVIKKLSQICNGDVNKLTEIPSLLMKIIIVKI